MRLSNLAQTSLILLFFSLVSLTVFSCSSCNLARVSRQDFKAVVVINVRASSLSMIVPMPNSSCKLLTLFCIFVILSSMSQYFSHSRSYKLFTNSISVCRARISFCSISISFKASVLFSPDFGVEAALLLGVLVFLLSFEFFIMEGLLKHFLGSFGTSGIPSFGEPPSNSFENW